MSAATSHQKSLSSIPSKKSSSSEWKLFVEQLLLSDISHDKSLDISDDQFLDSVLGTDIDTAYDEHFLYMSHQEIILIFQDTDLSHSFLMIFRTLEIVQIE